MRKPMLAAQVHEDVFQGFAPRCDTEPRMEAVRVDVDGESQDDVDTLRLIEVALAIAESERDLDDAVDSCTNPIRRSSSDMPVAEEVDNDAV